jgi:hypothetical protein
MNKQQKNDKFRSLYIILSTIALLLVAGKYAYQHFAKTTTVEAIAKTVVWVEERLAIGTHDQRVLRQEGAVERAKNRLRFEKKQGQPTREEEEDVAIQQKRLEEVVKQRQELIDQYKNKKK